MVGRAYSLNTHAAVGSSTDTNRTITVVQVMDTDWTKQSRGAPGANKRNATPQALPLPLEKRPVEGYSLIEHSSSFHESRGFEDPRVSVAFESLTLGQTMRYGAVLVQKEADRLRVSWGSPDDAGMPIRPQKKNDVLELPLNQWGRVIYNGRFSGMEGSFWRYRQRVLNIGLFEEVVASVFVATEPHAVMDKTAVLY